MDLDNLKEVWREHAVNIPSDTQEDILSMLQKKSQNPIAKIKRNLRWELLTVIILYTASIFYYAIANKGRYWELGLLLFLLGVLFIIYYYYKNKLLKEMECVSCEVKSNLQRQVTTLEKYIRLYFVAGTLLTPVAYFITGLIVFFKSPGFIITSAQFLTWFIGIGIAITILFYFFNAWYINKLYGQHVRKLKELLRQMEEIPDDNFVSSKG